MSSRRTISRKTKTESPNCIFLLDFRNSQSNSNITCSAIASLGEYLFLGGTHGDIHISRRICLSFDKNEIADNITKNRMCQAKSYQGHVSYVNQIETDSSNTHLFTTGINDQCVFQWTITQSNKYWDLDFVDYDITKEDVFLAEVEPKLKYHSIIDELLTLRDEIVHMQEKIDETVEPELYLELHKIIGRRAYNRRNNLLYTDDGQLAFNAGSMIVLLKLPEIISKAPLDDEAIRDAFTQKFLEPDKDNIFSISPEISAIATCQNGQQICCGTTQTNSKLLIWEVPSRTFIKSITLNNCCTVLMIEYAHDARTVVCIALTKAYTQCIYLIDTHKSKILGVVNNLYSIPFKIKDVVFLPNSRTEFITCGIQHLTHWYYKGEILNFKEFHLKQKLNKGQIVEDEDDYEVMAQQDSTFKITFLAIINIQSYIITGGEDGRVIEI